MDNIFFHNDLKVFTDNGIKSARKLKDTEMIACVNDAGEVRYVQPIIGRPETSGLYYRIKTDFFTMCVSANSRIFIDGNLYDSFTAHDIAMTMVGGKIKVPAIFMKDVSSGLPWEDNHIKLYAIMKMNKAKRNGSWITFKTASEPLKTFVQDLCNLTNLRWYGYPKGNNTEFFIEYDFKGGYDLPKSFIEGINSEQALMFMDTLFAFDCVGKKVLRTTGQNMLYNVNNMHTLPLVAMKAGYRCYFNSVVMTKEIKQVINIKKVANIEVELQDVFLMQHEATDVSLTIPKSFIGYICLCDGQAVIMPNN